MANLNETPIWEDGVFQLEKTTPPLGGAPAFNGNTPIAGHANAQALQLANRTAALRKELKALSDAIDELEINGVPFTQVGEGAVQSTTNDKIKQDIVSVVDYGAGTGGDDDLAFSNAAKAAKASVNITGARGTGGIPRALMCQVRVPDGNYTLTRTTDVDNRDVTWVLSPGAVVQGVDYINGNVFRPGQRHNSQSSGSVDYACGYSIRVDNPELDSVAEITGVPMEAGFGRYGDRDTVGLYVDNTSRPALISAPTAIYTSTTATISPQSADTLKKLRVGMFIDTLHSPNRYTGILKSWNSDGSVLTVNGWYLVNNVVNPPSTPPNSAGLKVNAYTKIWAHNANVFLPADGAATNGATGFELGIANNKGDSPTGVGTSANRVWGFDAASLSNGQYSNQAGFITRGKWVYGHATWGDITYPYMATDENGILSWRVDSMGNMEIGKNGTGIPSTPYFDFHSSGNAVDYDVRMIVSGGTTANGAGQVQFAASSFVTNSHLPSANSLYTLGDSTHYWQNTYTATLNAVVGNIDTIELGGNSLTTASTRYIDSHTSGNNIDYDARIEFAGGSTTIGTGSVTIRSASLDVTGTIRPLADLGQTLGQSTRRFVNTFSQNLRPGVGGVIWTSGAGSPEGNLSAPVGSLYTRSDGSAGSVMYVKETGSGNTGWVAK